MDRRVAQALAGSAAASAAVAESAAELRTASGLAWRWVVRTDALDLYAVGGPTRTPTRAERRTTWIAGGGALHRARVALAADGLASRATLLPDTDPDHLATLVPVGPIAVTDEAVARFDATEGPRALPRGRHEVPPGRRELARALVAAATGEGVAISVRQEADGLIAVLYGEDTPAAWLRAGEALSAVRLEAARHGRTAVPTLAGRERPRPPAGPPAAPENERRQDHTSVVYVHLRVGQDSGSANSR
jgi:hypothetical protein